MSELPKRATIRWQGYNYANAGEYYLTICTQDRLHLFGRIVDGVMHPSPIGEWAQRCWDAIPEHMPHVDVGVRAGNFPPLPVSTPSTPIFGS